MAQIEFNEFDFRKVHPIKLPFAEKYIYDVDNIFYADTGLLDARQTNMFFQEAGRMLINAINLFCDGYFDCAFYSLRQSFEISVSSLYLNEKPNLVFKSGGGITHLSKLEDEYQEMKNKIYVPIH